MRTFSARLCLSVFLVLAVFWGGTGAEDVKVHRVVPGDTLWDISQGYLKDPFLWPAVWRTNPGISNPDLIFPGQDVRLPSAEELRAKNAAEGGAGSAEPGPEGTPVTVSDAMKTPLGSRPSMPAETSLEGDLPSTGTGLEEGPRYLAVHQPVGVITDQLPSAGRVLSAVDGQAFAGTGDLVNVEAPDTSPGTQYGVYRDAGKIYYPGTWKMRSKPLGNLVMEMGVIEMRMDQGGAIHGLVQQSFEEIMAGDFLGPVPVLPKIERDFTSPANSGVSGMVVAARDLSSLTGNKDIVYLDLGANDGIAPGNRLSVFTDGGTGKEGLYVGEVVILRVTPSTSAAIVFNTTREIRPGDRVAAPL